MAELFCSALQTSWSSSRVTTGNSGCLSCWPREVQSSIRVAKESWGLLSSYDGEFRMPLVLAQGSPIFHSSCEGKLGIALE